MWTLTGIRLDTQEPDHQHSLKLLVRLAPQSSVSCIQNSIPLMTCPHLLNEGVIATILGHGRSLAGYNLKHHYTEAVDIVLLAWPASPHICRVDVAFGPTDAIRRA
jgi:hypothetical protein